MTFSCLRPSAPDKLVHCVLILQGCSAFLKRIVCRGCWDFVRPAEVLSEKRSLCTIWLFKQRLHYKYLFHHTVCVRVDLPPSPILPWWQDIGEKSIFVSLHYFQHSRHLLWLHHVTVRWIGAVAGNDKPSCLVLSYVILMLIKNCQFVWQEILSCSSWPVVSGYQRQLGETANLMSCHCSLWVLARAKLLRPVICLWQTHTQWYFKDRVGFQVTWQ